jgi:hypothetical protein
MKHTLLRWTVCRLRGHIPDIGLGFTVSKEGKFLYPMVSNTCKRCHLVKKWVDYTHGQELKSGYQNYTFPEWNQQEGMDAVRF